MIDFKCNAWRRAFIQPAFSDLLSMARHAGMPEAMDTRPHQAALPIRSNA
jgi:hypothetical protein